MERVVNKAKNHAEADEWDVQQCINMTSEQRQLIARKLKERVYGKHNPDVKEYHRKIKKDA